MAKFKALVSAFGFDKNAADMANDLNASYSPGNVQKILAGMKARKIFYRGPRRLMSGLSSIARQAFRNTKPMTPRAAGQVNAPFID